MPTVLQFRRGTTAQNNSFTGSAGELSIDTDLDVIRVHDGSHPGGYALIGANAAQTMTNKTLVTPTITDGMTANGNITISNGTSDISFPTTNGNIQFTVGGSDIFRVAPGGIVNDLGNGVGNIGNSTGYWNTVFAKATSAQYADVAEKYIADQIYPAGTVIEIGGVAEVTATKTTASTKIAGVVSTNPALIMNAGETALNTIEVALIGRVPCCVVGTINRGDLLCSSDTPGHARSLPAPLYQPGAVIGKALEDHNSDGPGVIEVLVGRL